MSAERKRALLSVSIFILTVAAFLPALRAGFVWDDASALVDNRGYRGLDLRHLNWMFASLYMGRYQPLAWLTFGIDFKIWGLKPLGFHLTSMLLHAANAALFFHAGCGLLSRALPRCSRRGVAIGAAAAALIFALHPLRVESVAYVTQRPDVLSGFLFLLATLACLRRRFFTAVFLLLACLLSGIAPLQKLQNVGPFLRKSFWPVKLSPLDYLPGGTLMGLSWALLAGAVVAAAWERRPRLVAGVVLLVATALGAATWRQCAVWRDDDALWSSALKAEPESVAARLNFGRALAGKRRLFEALSVYEEAEALAPDNPEVLTSHGAALLELRRYAEAEARFRRVVELEPSAAARENLRAAQEVAKSALK